MIINKVKLKNITSFRGEHVLQFNHRHGQTVSIISGENGAGKTSLLQALKVVLYGQFLFNNNKKDYNTYLNGFIRNDEVLACIELGFNIRTLSGVENYSVCRNWKRRNDTIAESLLILKDGNPYRDIAPKFYQEFIFSIAPVGMMDLFFFDGEKINNLGESLSSGKIGDAVKKLMGFAAVDSLGKAVRQYILDSMKEKTDYPKLKNEFNALDTNLKDLHDKGEHLHQQFAETNEAIKKSKKALSNKEAIFFEAGGNIASSHEAMKERKRLLEQKMESAQVKICELSQDSLPLCVLSDELNELVNQLASEREWVSKRIIRDYANEKSKLIEEVLIKNKYSSAARFAVLNVLDVSGESIPDPIHALSSKQTDEIFATISKANGVIRAQAQQLFFEIESTRQELETLESAIETTSNSTDFAEILSEMRVLDVQLSKYEGRREEIIQLKKRAESDVRVIENKKNLLLKQIEKWGSESKSEELANRFPNILDRIKNDLVERRLKTLQRLIVHNMKILFRKDNLVHGVRITPDLSIKLIGLNDSYIDMRCLSAGEQQMLATAIQWALASLASGSMPTVIDTPLARLDSYHRKSLVRNYYPAINQLILLSTDEEIDDTLFQELAPYLSDVYSLKYDKQRRCTEITKIEF
ncbi:DNA sulfur modification protein DndD [Desulfovibrio aminophilus]|uniref:DNA sulfur modification protein DndD n=1 Tax=Desulfovibrio aminophilus TaxID=81425 RepID=UPI003397C34E